ncbi:MAG: helix-turn-helix transcriptional regulator, partial [Patescibacteria group bacterium]
MNRLIETLETKRKQLGLTSTQFAAKLGMHHAAYSRAVNGHIEFARVRLVNAAEILGITREQAALLRATSVDSVGTRSTFSAKDLTYLAAVAQAMDVPLTLQFMREILEKRDAHIEEG